MNIPGSDTYFMEEIEQYKKEIHRLKAELEFYQKQEMRVHIDCDVLERQLAEVSTEKEAAISLVHDYKAQLAEARAEVERLKEEIRHYEDQGLWIPDKADQTRQEAARDCCKLVNTFAMPGIEHVLVAIKAKFGLEE